MRADLKRFGLLPTCGFNAASHFLARRLPLRVRSLRSNILWPIGFIGGLFGGLLGIGGGSAVAPLLLLSGKLRPAQISGTALTPVLVIAAVGPTAYATFGHVDLKFAWRIAMGSAIGSVLGALLARRLSMPLMTGIFLLLMPYFAIKELWPSLAAPAIVASAMSLATLGLASGVLSSPPGISAAGLVVPSLVAFFLIDHVAARGVAISVALNDSMAGVIAHWRTGNVDYDVFRRQAPLALIGAFLVMVWLVTLSRWLGISFSGRTSSRSAVPTEAVRVSGFSKMPAKRRGSGEHRTSISRTSAKALVFIG